MSSVKNVIHEDSFNGSSFDHEKKHSTVDVSVVLLDQSEVVFKISKRDRGQVLLDLVFQHAKIGEIKFFGLQFPNNIPDTLKWLDPSKSIRKQFKRGYPFILFLRIKFYATDISMLKEDLTLFNLYLQLKLDLLERRLHCTSEVAVILSGLALQSEVGDYDKNNHCENYVSAFRFVPEQTEKFKNEVKEMHKLNLGLSPLQAATKYIETAQNVPMYGIEIHVGYDSDDHKIDIGVDGNGIIIKRNDVIAKQFKWSTIIKISFKRKQFFIHLKPSLDQAEPTNLITTFHMDNYRCCKRLWKSCVDFHSFYRQIKCLNNLCTHQQKDEKNAESGSDPKFQISNPTNENDHFCGSQTSVQINSNHCENISNDVDVLHQSSESLQSQKSSSTERLPTPVMLPIQYHKFDVPEPSHLHKSTEISTIEAQQFTVRNGTLSNVVLIHLEADEADRYGFNVKGGFDQNMPITISKVAKGLPASKSNPPIQVGDKLLQVNGRDVSHHTHDQIVRFIQSTRESHTGHLTLLLEKFLDDEDENVDEDQIIDDEDQLVKSMEWLENLIETDDILHMFEKLYRRKPDGTFENARLNQNLSKNRYRDISPYDDTRVKLQDSSNDYINANYVNMQISSSTSRYIACQGPLSNTAVDFWLMVWEQNTSFIVMLTALMERGRSKCFQYWPNYQNVERFGNFVVESISEEQNDSFAYRDFYLHYITDDDSSYETRRIKQMQYIAWPDHGVPDDSSDFLDFVFRVRHHRESMTSPCIIHCSAGIGRTGVLITMETALCLIEENQPVYPIQIARSMRDQRAMMIQTPGQFKFVCKAILRVYKEGLVKPSKFYENNGLEST